MEIAILFALILLNGLFAMSELALVSARKARLQKQAEEGDRSAAAAIKLGEDPTRFLSTIQIGITSIGVLNGIVGEAALAAPLALWLTEIGVPAPHHQYLATGLVVILITYFSIVVGELVPKRIGQSHPETLARLVARPIDLLAIATKPFVLLLSASTQALLKLLGVKDSGGNAVTEEEIHAMLAEGTTAGVIESHEHTMVRNVFRLTEAARAWFILQWHGVDAKVLDGGWPAIQRAQNVVPEQQIIHPIPVRYARPGAHEPLVRLIQRNSLLEKLGTDVQILDARTQAEHVGEDLRSNTRGGHLPGAKSVPHGELLEADGTLKSGDELRARLQQAGVDSTAPVVTHCDAGGRAALSALAAVVAGQRDVSAYYLSFSDWAADGSCPIVKP